MTRRLFSTFDPHSLYFYPINWRFIFLFIFLFILKIFIKNRNKLMLNNLVSKIILFNISATLSKISFLSFLFYILFMYLCINNFLGLIPYIFSVSSHIRFIISLRFIYWLSLLCATIVYYISDFIIHLVPEGTPYRLILLIVLIETLRYFIRPFTLSVRLIANMVAGHLLLTLLGVFIFKVNYIGKFFLIVGGIRLTFLESIVILIQAYVFTLLISLYFTD